jgi:hypothetical protein
MQRSQTILPDFARAVVRCAGEHLKKGISIPSLISFA